MPSPRPPLRAALTALLIVSAVVFAAGIAAERSVVAAEQGRLEAPSSGVGGEAIQIDSGELREQTEQSGGTHVEGASESSSVESASGASDERGGEAATSAEGNPSRERTGEAAEHAVFGIDPEANSVPAGALVVTFLLAAAVWLRPTPAVLALVGVFAAAFVILDVREVLHQQNESHTGLAALASLLALLHLAIAASAVVAFWETRRRGSAASF
jgi:hypothetical protein